MIDLKKYNYIKQIKMTKGIIRNKIDVDSYIKYGYNPEKLLFNFNFLSSDVFEYAIAKSSNYLN